MTADLEAKAEQILKLYEYPKAAMLPVLWLVQEKQGYVSEEGEAWVASTLGVPRSHVREAVSFYNMFHTKPVGRRELRVCTSLPCLLRGSGDVLDQIKERLKIGCGPINNIDAVFNDPQVNARDMLIQMPHPALNGEPVSLVANPLRLSETEVSYRHTPPLLGQHTDEVLEEMLGADEAERKSLREAGVI